MPLAVALVNDASEAASCGLPLRPGDVAAAAEHQVVAEHEPGQCPLPGAGLVVVDHRHWQMAGRDQLEQVFVVHRL